LILFGPKGEVIRVSNNDRRKRFLVAAGVVETGDPSARWAPNLLGSGDSWEAALEAAELSQPGKQANEDHKAAVDLIKMANATKSPEEFVDKFTEQQLEIAKGLGATEEEMLELKSILNNAKSKLNKKESTDGNEGTKP